MTKNWSFAKFLEILLKNWGQWSYLKINISTKSKMSIPLTVLVFFFLLLCNLLLFATLHYAVMYYTAMNWNTLQCNVLYHNEICCKCEITKKNTHGFIWNININTRSIKGIQKTKSICHTPDNYKYNIMLKCSTVHMLIGWRKGTLKEDRQVI